MAKFQLYTKDLLPPGFEYPSKLQEYSNGGQHPMISPWWFIDAASKAGKLAHSIRLHDGRNLVPFAKVDDGRGDVACFDGDDASGNPKVLMLILDDSGRSYSYDDFDQWLQAALQDAAR
jgi:hypothetical protein